MLVVGASTIARSISPAASNSRTVEVVKNVLPAPGQAAISALSDGSFFQLDKSMSRAVFCQPRSAGIPVVMVRISLLSVAQVTKRLAIAEKGRPAARMRLNVIAMKGLREPGAAGFTTEASEDRQVKPLLAAENACHDRSASRIWSNARDNVMQVPFGSSIAELLTAGLAIEGSSESSYPRLITHRFVSPESWHGF